MNLDVALLRRDAIYLLQEFPYEMLTPLVNMMSKVVRSHYRSGSTPPKLTIALEVNDEMLRFDAVPIVPEPEQKIHTS